MKTIFYEKQGLLHAKFACVRLSFLLLMLVSYMPIWAQNVTVKGVVVDDKGESLPGVNVIEQGTQNGTVTNIDGEFELNVRSSQSYLKFSFIGYSTISQKVVIGNRMRIVLEDMFQDLNEVVVVGYGTMKKKLLTGATVQIEGDDIQRLNMTTPLGALQSQSPGVTITQNSGMPGEDYKVTIRGLGTTGSSSPLYVIDGVAGGSISALNPADIESVDVLKDAASAAIYGARAANGVILVTTRQGREGKAELSYDGYVGWQKIAKKPELLNAQQYIYVQNKIAEYDGSPARNWASLLPSYLYDSIQDGTWNGTNWFNESVNDAAPVTSHAVNLTGGSDKSRFSLGFSYISQDGIIGKPKKPENQKYTFRVNSNHTLLKGNGFDIIKIGENLSFNYNRRSSLAINDWSYNDVRNLLVATPLLPVFDRDGRYYDMTSKQTEGWKVDDGAFNPLGLIAKDHGLNKNRGYSLYANAYLEIQPIKNLKFKSSFGYQMSSSSYRSYKEEYNFATTITNSPDKVYQSMSSGHRYTWENTLSYLFKVKKNTFDVLVGQSIEKSGIGETMSAQNGISMFTDFDHAWLSNTGEVSTSYTTVTGAPQTESALSSVFGRVNWNYNETYLASIVMRADGSSNFARGHRWGYFPSVSAGWVITNESFMEPVRNWMDFFKIRASWGQNGNCDITNFQYLSTFLFGRDANYSFGNNKVSQVTGAYSDILANPDVTWETSEQLNIGFDARFFGARLGVNFDWYKKTTKDWLVQAPILTSYGTNAPYINGGDVENKGVEIMLSWNDHVNDFKYGARFNLAHNKNKVTRIANTEGIIHGPTNVLSNNTAEMFRAQVGSPIGYFWGYKTAGIFQNQEQVNSTKVKLEGAEPGDVIFVDNNDDGQITDEDKTMIGNPNPDVTMGITLDFAYKGFDLSLTGMSALGHQIAKSYRSFAQNEFENYTTEILGCWDGEGTSNRLPKFSDGAKTNWTNISDIYIEDADYFRLSNLTIGYDFKQLWKSSPLSQIRLYFTAQNLFTITNYSGMDPEVGYGGGTAWGSAIDLAFYPSSRSYLVGVNLKF